MNSPGLIKDTFIYDLFRDLSGHTLSYIYQGNFSIDLSNKILALAENNLENIGESTSMRKKVYFIMVESLQNITRHNDYAKNSDQGDCNFFVIQRAADNYYVTSGNLIENSNIPLLESKLQKINSLDKDSLKEYAKEVLVQGELSDKGGAGLGLIEMARKSGNKLAWHFKPIDARHSHFYFQIKVSGKDATNDSPTALNEIALIHTAIKELKIDLIYQVDFNQETIVNLLAITEGHIANGGLAVKKRNFNIVVELLQNIFKHADEKSPEKEGKGGIFLIGEKDQNYVFMAGNLVRNEKVPALKEKLDRINGMNTAQLEELFTSIMRDDEMRGDKSAGLGFIDMKLKSQNNLQYSLTPLDNTFTFFEINVYLPKN